MGKIIFDKNARLNLALWGDPQVSCIYEPQRFVNFNAACKAVRDADGPCDALLLAGDIAEFGLEKEYDMAAACLAEAAGNTAHILCACGNHDVRIRGYQKQLRRFRAFLSQVPHALEPGYDHYYCAAEIKGYRFILLGADRNSFESAWLSKAQLAFLEKELTEAEKTGKPAFVLNHQPLKRTNGLPVTWLGRGSWRGQVGLQSDRLREILSSHGTVFYLTGHLHYGVSRYNVESAGRLHMIAAPTVGCPNHGETADPAQGFVLSVYDDHVSGTAYNFAAAEPLDESIANARFDIKL